jgi:ABC-type lipoprotein export system ATPase subunit
MGEGLLSLEAISKSYWRGPLEVRVLAAASLDVRAGELVAVWGKRGAGKTTLLRIAAGLETPDEGSVCFDGDDLSTLSGARHAQLMREQIGWVRREGPRNELRMLDYIALPLLIGHDQRRAHARARDTLRRVGMSACAEQRWDSLSDGERAVVAIAHGIVRAPRLLLVDDPTGNLGLREREDVMELLRTLAQESELAVLSTAPDLSAAMGSHQIKALSGGRILEPPEPSDRRGNVIDFPGTERSA